MCPLVPFYDMLLFPVLVSFVLSSPVITESYLLRPVVLILNTVACVVVQRFITYRGFFCAVVAGFFLAVVNGLLSLYNLQFLRG